MGSLNIFIHADKFKFRVDVNCTEIQSSKMAKRQRLITDFVASNSNAIEGPKAKESVPEAASCCSSNKENDKPNEVLCSLPSDQKRTGGGSTNMSC